MCQCGSNCKTTTIPIGKTGAAGTNCACAVVLPTRIGTTVPVLRQGENGNISIPADTFAKSFSLHIYFNWYNEAPSTATTDVTATINGSLIKMGQYPAGGDGQDLVTLRKVCQSSGDNVDSGNECLVVPFMQGNNANASGANIIVVDLTSLITINISLDTEGGSGLTSSSVQAFVIGE